MQKLLKNEPHYPMLPVIGSFSIVGIHLSLEFHTIFKPVLCTHSHQEQEGRERNV